MRVALFCHSLVSCWNHGNAHFLRGIARELIARGHEVRVFEPADGWSRSNLVRDHGEEALKGFSAAYPELASTSYEGVPDLEKLLQGCDLVLVHEWTEPEVVAAIGRYRRAGGRFILLFHDTHHRVVTEPAAMRALDLDAYDGILAFGEVLRERYQAMGWGRRAWVWHEAADTSHFRPLQAEPQGDLVWVGNWGDDERTSELREFLFEPAHNQGLTATIHGVRYPEQALAELRKRKIAYAGWLANHQVPEIFARYHVTVHVPRRPYVQALRGIPTIRVFEALACGIPLVSSPWEDTERLFPPGAFLKAGNGEEMERALRDVLHDEDLRRSLIETGLECIRSRHSCVQRVDQLLAIHASLTNQTANAMEQTACA